MTRKKYMTKKLNVAVLMGGKSSEHEISLMSGMEVVKNLDSKKYQVKSVVITKDGKSFIYNSKRYPLGQLLTVNCQLFFIAMHGPYGEDGKIQGLLEVMGIHYTGSGVLASALGMNKIYSRKIFTHSGLKVPETAVFNHGDSQSKIFKTLKYPVFVKPTNQGSSVGTSKAKNKNELEKALKTALSFSSPILIEEYIQGTEVTCAILGNDKLIALPLVEIVPKKEFFDLEAKYDAKLTEEICPARISKTQTKKAQQAALTAYKSLDCKGFGRVDMIIKGNNIYVLEVNTIPGLTPVSLFPKAAKAAGITYPKLLDKVIQLALE